MRILLKVNIPVESGNAAAKAGKLGATIQSILSEQKPEAVYFTDNFVLGVPIDDLDQVGKERALIG